MPVYGLSDRHSAGSGLPRLGRLFKGAKRSEEDLKRNRSGREQETWRIEFDALYLDLQPIWDEFYGDQQLKTIPGVYLMGNTVDDAFESYMESWGSNKLLKHKCDTKMQVKWFNPEIGKVDNTPKPCEQPNCDCQLVGRLNILIPDFQRYAGVLGFFCVNTGSFRDVSRIFKYLSDIQSFYGSVGGIPFFLTRVAEPVEIPEVKDGKATGKRFKSTKHFISLIVDPEFVKTTDMKNQQRALPANVDPSTGEKMLPDRAPEWSESNEGESASPRNAQYAIIGDDGLEGLVDSDDYDNVVKDDKNDPNWGHEMSLSEPSPEDRLEAAFGPAGAVVKNLGEKPKEHWAKNASNRTRVLNLLQELGFETQEQQARALNKVDRRISDKPTEMRLGQSGFETLEDMLAALRQAFPKPQPNWNPQEIEDWLLEDFNRPAADFLREFKAQDWSQFDSAGAAADAVRDFALKNQWEVVSGSCQYHKQNNRTYIAFNTPLGEMRLYGGRDALEKLTSPDYMDKQGAADWKPDQEIDLIPELWLSYEPREGYIAVTGAVVLPQRSDELIDF